MDAVALAEEERLHARVPAPGLVPEVDAGFDQLADVHLGVLEGGRGGPARSRGGGDTVGSAMDQSPSRLCVRPGSGLPNPRLAKPGASTAGAIRNV